MPSVMISGFAFLSVLAAVGRAAPPTTTEAIQTFLSVSNLDATQASQVATRFNADRNAYYSSLTANPAYKTAYSVAATAFPETAKSVAATNPELFLASLARADRDDLPPWYTAMPMDVQDFWRSVGSRDIEMYTSEVSVARPLPSEVSASLSSVSSRLESLASSVSVATESRASVSNRESVFYDAQFSSYSQSLASARATAVLKGAAPASPATSGHMWVVAAGVAILAGLVSMAML
ncbi:MAG: hypothetical protein Q9208_003463 [Pyrenodesmia sp. 3 TL-2023]